LGEEKAGKMERGVDLGLLRTRGRGLIVGGLVDPLQMLEGEERVGHL
jgi:hypothetical protein